MFETIEHWLNQSDAAKILFAYIITLPLGWLREKEAHSVGLRTFPIVAVASCGYLLLARSGATGEAYSRILQGLIAGIGFVGGGAIVKEGPTVRGTSTAASIWNTGAIGAAVALNHYDIAVILAVINAVTVKFMMPLKVKLDSGNHLHPVPEDEATLR